MTRPYYQWTNDAPRPTREEELDLMQDRADALKLQLEDIEARMRDLEGRQDA